MRNKSIALLQNYNIHPVLLDIGASQSFPDIWKDIKKGSIYLGFDPDLRDLHNSDDYGFYKATIFNSAVVEDNNATDVIFYLTKSPYCSSTLSPDSQSLSNYLFSGLFEVEKTQIMKASNLNNLLKSQNIQNIDWFKTDSQGIDLRLYKSLKEDIRSKVLAIDIEPGLIDAYVGEDLFVDAHAYLTQNGFWLSNLEVCGSNRIKNSTFYRLESLGIKNCNYGVLQSALKVSPGWCEARYLRSTEWISQNKFSKNQYILLIIFSLMDKQLGYAFDVLFEYERIFGSDDFSKAMLIELSDELKRDLIKPALYSKIKQIGNAALPIFVKNWLTRYMIKMR